MVKNVLLDCGGVMCRPKTGIWLYPRNFHALMGAYLTGITPEEHRRARNAAEQKLNAKHHLYTEDVMYQQFREYYADCYCGELGLKIPDTVLDQLAAAETFDDERFLFYDDCIPALKALQEKYHIGMVSDTHPDLRRALRNYGMLPYFEALSFSCENGVFKPDPLMYTRALEMMQADPAETVFVDDLEKNLHGAERCGIRGIKMIREKYTDEPILIEGDWKGLVVHSLLELTTVLEEL